MYRISVPDAKSRYRLAELANMFLRPSDYEFVIEPNPSASFDLIVGATAGSSNKQKQLVYDFFAQQTGRTLDWGILTGVRPVKLLAEMLQTRTLDEANALLREEYRVSKEKTELLSEVYRTQLSVNFDEAPPAVGLYIGIPFCPSRCLYCSFPSNVISREGSEKYLEALHKEIDAVAGRIETLGWYAESIYIGGGTPTSLNVSQLQELLRRISQRFITDRTREFTVECGRPDTIDKDKLNIIAQWGAERISINPQTMVDRTLEYIGRSHNAQQIRDAFSLAKTCGIPMINADLIAGLPGEDPKDFKFSLDQVLLLKPANITVHTLAVKKASRLIEEDQDYAYRTGAATAEMLADAGATLRREGYRPYYLYRQKHMAGNLENVGYALPGTESLYNIRIMAEDQSIIALGAGGISKIYYPEENRLERIPNVTNYEIYIERIEEMIQRKETGIQ
ncbi:MAG TPA: coproporphyrinogen dehydrogenase HemZ [Clostridiales bacterium]|nr:coproporphyrinogen dehydrogenase HemZ [Clostridiales bacterium]